ncbi:MAG: hypothetical protein IT406_01260 [Candidatus Yanofskybacteria bacterium]|nr:hypothetical protein [Candidatus Yanofskybacteria bacterium]
MEREPGCRDPLDRRTMGIITKIGERVKRSKDLVWTAVFVALAGWSAYNLGLLRAQQGVSPAQDAAVFRARATFTPVGRPGQGSARSTSTPAHSDPRVLVSKTSSSKKYHHPWCASANRIKEANRIWFPTAEAAQAAGYTLAANCKE